MKAEHATLSPEIYVSTPDSPAGMPGKNIKETAIVLWIMRTLKAYFIFNKNKTMFVFLPYK